MEILGVVDVFLVLIAVMVSWVYAYIKLIKCRVYRMFVKAVFFFKRHVYEKLCQQRDTANRGFLGRSHRSSHWYRMAI